jgi:dipeptidyl aminopeptidase/acylaminoacyl peptidase
MARRAPVLEDLYRLREAADPRISPDGARIAFVVTSVDRDADENLSSIWTVAVDGSAPVQLTRGRNDAQPRWAPDGSTLAFLRREPEKPSQIWVLPTGGGEARKLTDLSLGAGEFVWSPDSTRLAVTAPVDIEGEPEDEKEKERRARAPVVIRSAFFKSDGTGLIGSKRMHLHIVDASTGQTEQITKNDLNVATPAWFPDGERIVFAGSTADRDVSLRTHLLAVPIGGGEPEEIAQWQGIAVAPVFTPGGASIVFCGQERVTAGHTRLFEVSAGGGAPKQLIPAFDRNVMVGGPAYPGAFPGFASHGRLIFCARDGGCTHVYEVANGEASKIIGGGDRVAHSFDIAGDTMAYLVSAPDIASDVFVVSTDGATSKRLTDLNEELIGELKLHSAVPRMFSAPDGREIHGWIVGDGKPGPLLVDVHGGPHNAWNPAFLPGAHIYQEILAAQGWNILLLNPRGSDGYGEDFFTGLEGRWGITDENDFLSAVDVLVEEGLADPERLAVCGYSYGGYMTNWLTARTGAGQKESLRSIQFAAAVSGGCVANEASMYGSSDLGYWIGVLEMGAELHEDRERYAVISPLSYVESVKTPTLLLHGENDDRCPVGQAEEWFVALKRLGVETELVRYPGASHIFILNGRPSHRVDYSRRIVDWLTSHV